MMEPLNFPPAPLNLTRRDGKVMVWDVFRKRKIQLTPEEWVRQHVLHYLVALKAVPQSLIASEYGISVNDMVRRCDGVVFKRDGSPAMIVECKAPSVKLTENVFHQIAQYNFKLKVQWLMMTNGVDTITAYINYEENKIDYVDEIPDFSKIVS